MEKERMIGMGERETVGEKKEGIGRKDREEVHLYGEIQPAVEMGVTLLCDLVGSNHNVTARVPTPQ